MDSEDDDERAESAMIAAAEFDPYADVRIESKNISFIFTQLTDHIPYRPACTTNSRLRSARPSNTFQTFHLEDCY